MEKRAHFAKRTHSPKYIQVYPSISNQRKMHTDTMRKWLSNAFWSGRRKRSRPMPDINPCWGRLRPRASIRAPEEPRPDSSLPPLSELQTLPNRAVAAPNWACGAGAGCCT
jgi:hypothetical protein